MWNGDTTAELTQRFDGEGEAQLVRVDRGERDRLLHSSASVANAEDLRIELTCHEATSSKAELGVVVHGVVDAHDHRAVRRCLILATHEREVAWREAGTVGIVGGGGGRCVLAPRQRTDEGVIDEARANIRRDGRPTAERTHTGRERRIDDHIAGRSDEAAGGVGQTVGGATHATETAVQADGEGAKAIALGHFEIAIVFGINLKAESVAILVAGGLIVGRVPDVAIATERRDCTRDRVSERAGDEVVGQVEREVEHQR